MCKLFQSKLASTCWAEMAAPADVDVLDMSVEVHAEDIEDMDDQVDAVREIMGDGFKEAGERSNPAKVFVQ